MILIKSGEFSVWVGCFYLILVLFGLFGFLVVVTIVAASSGLSRICHLLQKLTTAELSTHENPVLFAQKTRDNLAVLTV